MQKLMGVRAPKWLVSNFLSETGPDRQVWAILLLQLLWQNRVGKSLQNNLSSLPADQ